MANIRKLYEADQTQLMPQTHEKAVIDNNGTTAETKFQMITNLVNQKQMEVGAVPSDLVPTIGSTNWVTSGGVYEHRLAMDSEIPSNTWVTGTVKGAINEGAGVYKNYPSWDYPKFIPVMSGTLIRVTASSQGICRVAFVKNTTMSVDGTVPYATGETTTHSIAANGVADFYVPSDAEYIHVPQKVAENVAFPSSVVTMVEAKSATRILRNEYQAADVKKQEHYFVKDLSHGYVIPQKDDINEPIYHQSYKYRVTLRKEPCLKGDIVEFVASADYPDEKQSFLIETYDKNNTKLYNSGWITKYTIVEDGYCTVVVSLNTTSSTAVAEMLLASIRFWTTVDGILKDYMDLKWYKDLEEGVYKRILLNNSNNVISFEGVSPLKNQARITKLANFGDTQSIAMYNDYIFRFYRGGALQVYQMDTFRPLGGFRAPYGTGASSGDIEFNAAWFSNEFYDADDEFPILYCQSIFTQPYLLGHRIQYINGVWSMTLVHSINTDPNRGNIILYDKQKDHLIYAGLQYMYRFARPKCADAIDGVSTLTDAELISTVERTVRNLDFGQDNSIFGNIAIGQSYSQSPQNVIFGVDLTTGAETFSMPAPKNEELEGLEWYNGRLYVGMRYGDFFEIEFLN